MAGIGERKERRKKRQDESGYYERGIVLVKLSCECGWPWVVVIRLGFWSKAHTPQ
jgi:hypothetical protein